MSINRPDGGFRSQLTGKVFNSRAEQVADDQNEMHKRQAGRSKAAEAAMSKLTTGEQRALYESWDGATQAARARNDALTLFLSEHSDVYVDNVANSGKVMAWLVAHGKSSNFTEDDLENAMIELGNAGQLELNAAGVRARQEADAANPARTVSEDEMYTMTLDELRARASARAAEEAAQRRNISLDGAGDGSTFENPFTGNRHSHGGRRW
jgi:hypothetical protein